MFKLLVVLSLLICVVFVGEMSAQDEAQKTKDLVAALDKTKYKRKEKKNLSIEVFVDIKNEAVVKADPTEYAGRYETDGYQLQLDVAKDGSLSGSGFDSFANDGRTSNFQLRDAHIQGALLTGTKIYDNGTALPFEAVFVNRTSRSGSNPNSINDQSTEFGIGFLQSNSAKTDTAWTNRVFLQRR